MHKVILALFVLLFTFSCRNKEENETTHTNTPAAISQVMDSVITRIYARVPKEKYDSIDEKFILQFLSPEEKQVLATQYLKFKVNVPATVSLMRHSKQTLVPFWLPEAGFVKTAMVVKNEEYAYEVWQKKVDAGLVELGINGFDMHRPVYFISVGPQNPDDKLSISDIYPQDYGIETMKTGAFTYHDWDELILTEVPQPLVGQKLFTTIRGRAREAHIMGGFRNTLFPSSAKPDQILLTWSGSPQKSVDIQWRTATSINDGIVRLWPVGEKAISDTNTVSAEKFVLQDRMLANDRYVHRFTAKLSNLQSGCNYGYQVGSQKSNTWSDAAFFETEPVDSEKFSFIWFGDTHRSPEWGKLLNTANKRHPEVAFYSIAGDLVTTGLYRDEWDKLSAYAGNVFSHKPLFPIPGNHDRQDGLGAWMYYQMFSLPENGPTGVDKESTYFFQYGNALFLMIDATSPLEAHTPWIEEKLANTDATWKFVFFHFPPYNFEGPYPDIQRAWVPIFDKYHVDMVMGGHIHYYMRSKPMFNSKVVDTPNKGTIYTISIGIPSNREDDEMSPEPYAQVRYGKGQFYQLLEINKGTLKYTTYDSEGKIKDKFVIQK